MESDPIYKTELSLNGKLFVQFVALIYLSLLHKEEDAGHRSLRELDIAGSP